MAIVNFRTGEVLSDRQIKSAIMSANGWTSAQYQKEYDKLRNRVRNYEQTTGTASTGKIKVNELLYQTSKAQKRYGGAYKPSKLVQGILATPSTGTGVVQRHGVSKKAFARIESSVLGAFTKFVQASRRWKGEAWQAYEGYQRIQNGELSRAGTAIQTAQASMEELRQSRAEAIKQKQYDAVKAIDTELKRLRADVRTYSKTIEELTNAPRTLADLKRILSSVAKSYHKAQGARKKTTGFESAIYGGY